jgi:hypothetical protein
MSPTPEVDLGIKQEDQAKDARDFLGPTFTIVGGVLLLVVGMARIAGKAKT